MSKSEEVIKGYNQWCAVSHGHSLSENTEGDLVREEGV